MAEKPQPSCVDFAMLDPLHGGQGKTGTTVHRRVTRVFLSGVSFIALNCSAFAADMPLKAPPRAPTPTYSWTGFYGGVHAGAGWPGRGDGSVDSQSFTFAPGPIESLDAKSDPFPFGGIQVGYNWQFQERWLIGWETDFSGSRHTNSSALLTDGGPITDNVAATRGLDWFGTARGRLGYLASPSLLAYATGGLAYGRTRNDFNQTVTGQGLSIITVPIVNGTRNVSVGWTAGAGLEWALDRKWSVKLEYDYLAFNDDVVSSTQIHFNSGGKTQTPNGVFNVDGPNNSAHLLQLGVNYHFWD